MQSLLQFDADMKYPAKPAPIGHQTAQQSCLFDDLPVTAPADRLAVLAIPVPAAAQNKAQRAFNKLVSQIRQQRDLLAAWQQFELRFHQRVAAELQPAQAQLTAARLNLLRLLDQLLTDPGTVPKLTKPQRRKLRAWAPRLAETVLEDGPDAEAEAIFDRHSDVSHADRQQIELAEAEAMFGHILGEEMIEGHQAETVEDLMRHAAEGLARAQAEHAARSADQPWGGSAKAKAVRQRQADAAQQAAQQASQSVREAFRKLASALHPDRETDPDARDHKTRLMQQANEAYQRQDLLTLLSMQLDLEQIDGQHLANLPEARLAHYNRVLREQLAALQRELGECTAHFRVGMGLNQRELTPAVVDNALARDIQELRHITRQIEQDTACLRDPGTRRDAIASMDMPDADDEGPDAFEAMLLMEALAGAPAHRPARKKGRRR